MSENYLTRMLKEEAELQSKIYPLTKFLESGRQPHIEEKEWIRLHLQLTYMKLYYDVLQDRIKYAAIKQGGE